MFKQKNSLHLIVLTSVMAALVFVSNFISVPIPVAIGDVTRIHLGNSICILAGLIAGPIGGGLAAGIGSGLYDLTNPAYIASAPFTFAFKFVLACIPGLFMLLAKNKKFLMGIIGAILGQIAYIILYLSKSYFQGILEGSAPEALIPSIITKFGTSTINAIIAVIVSVALYNVISMALKKSKLIAN
ncbi:MAG: ECF transporter S component [Clostridia bacterium]